MSPRRALPPQPPQARNDCDCVPWIKSLCPSFLRFSRRPQYTLYSLLFWFPPQSPPPALLRPPSARSPSQPPTYLTWPYAPLSSDKRVSRSSSSIETDVLRYEADLRSSSSFCSAAESDALRYDMACSSCSSAIALLVAAEAEA